MGLIEGIIQFIPLLIGLFFSLIFGFIFLLAPPFALITLLIYLLSKYFNNGYLKSVYKEPSKHPFFVLITSVPFLIIWYSTIGKIIIDLRILEFITLSPYFLFKVF